MGSLSQRSQGCVSSNMSSTWCPAPHQCHRGVCGGPAVRARLQTRCYSDGPATALFSVPVAPISTPGGVVCVCVRACVCAQGAGRRGSYLLLPVLTILLALQRLLQLRVRPRPRAASRLAHRLETPPKAGPPRAPSGRGSAASRPGRPRRGAGSAAMGCCCTRRRTRRCSWGAPQWNHYDSACLSHAESR